jgi:type II secretory pathway pseudopilin PulG
MPTGGRPGPNDTGETLIELIMSVAVMGIAVVAIVGGIATSILMSDIHRKQTTAGANVRNYAEAVETYVTVPGNFNATTSPIALQTAVAAVFAPPTGFTAAVTSVQCWNDPVFGTCSAGNTVQKVTLSVASTDARASESLAVIVRKQP